MTNKEKAHEHLSIKMSEMSLQYMAKNYAVNVMLLKRLNLLFAQQQKGGPLTEQEIITVSENVQDLQLQSENTAIADLHKKLETVAGEAAAAACKEDLSKEE